MIRTIAVVFLVLALRPPLSSAQDPAAKVPTKVPPQDAAAKVPAITPTAKLPVRKPVPSGAVLTARLERPLSGARTIRVGFVRWACRDQMCTTADLSVEASDVKACLALRQHVGTIEAFGDDQHRLTPAELRKCNARPIDARPGDVVFGDRPPGARPPRAGFPPGAADDESPPRHREPISDDVILGAQPPEPYPDIGAVDVELRAPELEIIEVRRFADVDRTIRLGDIVSVEVVVRNTGNGSAAVRAGSVADARREGAALRYGPTRNIGAGSTSNLPLEIVASGANVSGDELRTTIFLFNPPRAVGDAPFGGLFGDSFRDGNNANNQYEVRFPFDRPRRYAVLATLEQIEILDDCDNVSEGDWFVHYTIAEVRGDAVVQMAETYWPDRNNPTDVDSGSTRRLDRLLRLSSVSPDSRLLIAVSAIDCDADTPFSWGFTLPHASLLHAFGVTLATGPWTAALMDCGGEEIWEASGTADNVGTQAYVVEPEEWQAGFVGGYRRDFQSADCDPHPFTPTVRVEATLR